MDRARRHAHNVGCPPGVFAPDIMVDETKLILIEGFPGSGKSTTAQWLARQWQFSGHACHWFYEQQPDHPVVGIPAGADYETWADYFAYRRERWSAFTADAAAGDGLSIMESALLQYPVFVMLRRAVASDTIVAFLQSVADTIRPLAPRLVYLKAPDPETAYRAVIARRGGAALIKTMLPAYETGEAGEFFRVRSLHGFEGLLAYWREHNAICERAIEVLGLRTLIVDPHDADWPERRLAIARFLGLTPRTDESPSPTALMLYVGHYHVAWIGDIPPVPARSHGRIGRATECVVSLENDRLVINGALWPENRLLWKEDNVFEAEAWPLEVVFESAAKGGIGRLSIRR